MYGQFGVTGSDWDMYSVSATGSTHQAQITKDDEIRSIRI